MKRPESTNEETIIAYLLGELPDDDAVSFERRYLADEDLFQKLEEVEDELVDDYVGGALSPAKEKAFETYFLRNAERASKVRFARAMTDRAVLWKKTRDTEIFDSKLVIDKDAGDSKPAQASTKSAKERWFAPVPRWREWAAIAAVVLFAVVSGALWFRVSSLQRELVAVRREEATLRQSESDTRKNAGELQNQLSDEQKQSQSLEDKIERLSTLDTPSRVIYAVQIGIDYLTNGSKGSGSTKPKTITIPANTSLIRIGVDFPKSDFQSFQASLRRRDRTVVWTRGGLRARMNGGNQSVSLAIPSEKLPGGDYDLVVSGVNANGDTESVAHYALKVQRKD
jgi:hypothetical protein